MNITVFLGAPGSGKGTQAKRLAERFGFLHFSTGDILRSAIQAGKPVGNKAKSFMDKGELVPDQIMIELIEDALAPVKPDARIILDGFPRTVAQADSLDANSKTKVNLALNFQLPESILIARLTGRRICKKCGESFHLVFMPPKVAGVCDKCAGELYQRTDDSESVAVRRLEVFKAQTQELIEYYKRHGKLREFDANKEVSKIENDIVKLLN